MNLLLNESFDFSAVRNMMHLLFINEVLDSKYTQ